MVWLRFAAIWVYCLGTIVVPGLHHALHGTGHGNHPAGCHANDCRHDENPFVARKAEKARQQSTVAATSAKPTGSGVAQSSDAGFSSPSAHCCSETCVVCLATSVLGHALATSQPTTVVTAVKSSLPIFDQDRWAQVCASESAPRGPPSACSEVLV